MVHGVPGYFSCGTQKPGYTIQVTGLNSSVKKTDLQGTFGEYGQIIRIDLVGNKAFLEFEDKKDAAEAIEEMNGKRWQGCSLRVDMKLSVESSAPRIPRDGERPSDSKKDRNGKVIDEVVSAVPQTKREVARSSVPDRRRREDSVNLSVPPHRKGIAERSSVPEQRKKDLSIKRRPSDSRSCSRSRSRSPESSQERGKRNKPKKAREHERAAGGMAMLNATKGKKDVTDNQEQPQKLSKKARKRKAKQDREQVEELEQPMIPSMPGTAGMALGLRESSSSQALDEASSAPKKAVSVNWSQKVQEWMKNKKPEPPSVPQADNGSVTPLPASEVQESTGAERDQIHVPVPDPVRIAAEQARIAAEQAKQDAEKAAKAAAEAKRCESEAVQKILDTALATKLKAAVAAAECPQPTPSKPAQSSQRPATVNARSNDDYTRPTLSGMASMADSFPAARPFGLPSHSRSDRGIQFEQVKTRGLAPEPQQRSEVTLTPASRNLTEEKQRKQRSPSPEHKKASSDSDRSNSRTAKRKRPRLFSKREDSPSQRNAVTAAKAGTNAAASERQSQEQTKGKEPVSSKGPQVEAPQAVKQVSVPAKSGFSGPTSLYNIGTTSASAPVPGWATVMRVQVGGLGVQADGTVKGHGGFVNQLGGEWLCLRCRWRNFSTRKQCVQCKLARPM
eukprot:gnl/MRDRNA2_/MRDRNA2_109281_c0_seq1.p1 gnl/MRDRNA2_/MRDRNA2_109281_c0~~gnl/MRDRNA2_/MRDRNA2_109281_c0_seq1.p1  ORF type:complete len:676 (+),score=116.89 gnl/MRDRNA2_/MRDRNA2_109281_c0_seq1:64-2091(+)